MMKRIYYVLSILAVLAILTTVHSCKDEEEDNIDRSARLIESFTFPDITPQPVGVIDNENGTVRIVVPFGTNRSNLVPEIKVSPGAGVDPGSGSPQDFSAVVIYTVTAANGAKKVYSVITDVGPSNVALITKFTLPDLFLSANAGQTESIIFNVPFGTDLSAVVVESTAGENGSTVQPASGTTVNLAQPVTFTVTAPDGISTRSYTLQASVGEQETGVRGVWLTNVDSDVLTSNAKILAAVDKCDQLNINTIFVVTYNKAATMYPSQVMFDLIGRRIDPIYGERDPLREIIDAAHAKGIKVFAWFEYGFAAFNGSPGPILQAKPEWAAINTAGNTVVKNGFYWLNSLHPDVQNFMTDLVLEVVRNYPDIDGVQGDDRLPAMPTEGGYDAYTVQKYKDEHSGNNPPTDRTDQNWIQWRADILNDYAKDLYQKVKEINPNCLVAMSPSPLDFGLREYLQDYTKWVKGGYCDLVSPQLYRRDNQGIAVYASLLGDQLGRVGQANIGTFYPGILSYLGGYVPQEQFLVDMIRENRKRGVTGEVHFFYNTLLAREKVFKAVYAGKALFPDL